MSEITGECFCGTVRFRINGPIGHAQMCHCSRCRKAFGGTGSAMGFLGPEQFEWLEGQENITVYANKQGIGLGFCNTCGSTIGGMKNGQIFGIVLGTLNGDPQVNIARHLWVDSKACWDQIGGDAPQFAEFPPKP